MDGWFEISRAVEDLVDRWCRDTGVVFDGGVEWKTDVGENEE